MPFIEKYIAGVNFLSKWSGRLAAILTSVLVVVICVDVVLRYLFQFSSVAFYDAEWHLFSLIFLVGAGFTLKADRHVRVDVFYSRFTQKQQAWVNLIGCLFFLVPFCLIVIKGGIPYVEVSFQMNEKSTDPGGLPYRYLIKSAIILGFALLLLQGTVLFLESLLTITGKRKKEALPANSVR